MYDPYENLKTYCLYYFPYISNQPFGELKNFVHLPLDFRTSEDLLASIFRRFEDIFKYIQSPYYELETVLDRDLTVLNGSPNYDTHAAASFKFNSSNTNYLSIYEWLEDLEPSEYTPEEFIRRVREVDYNLARCFELASELYKSSGIFSLFPRIWFLLDHYHVKDYNHVLNDNGIILKHVSGQHYCVTAPGAVYPIDSPEQIKNQSIDISFDASNQPIPVAIDPENSGFNNNEISFRYNFFVNDYINIDLELQNVSNGNVEISEIIGNDPTN